MKIAQKLLATMLAISLLPMIVVGTVGFILSQGVLRHQIQSQIDNTEKHQLERINTINSGVNTQLNNIEFKIQLRLLLGQYNAKPSTSVQMQLNQALQDIVAGGDTFQQAYVAGPNGKVVASTDTTIIGRDLTQNEAYQTGLKAPSSSVLFRNVDGELYQYLAVPLTLNDRLLGVAVVEATAAPYLVVTRDYSEVGKTGETYLTRQVNHTGPYYYLNPLRFSSQAALSKTPGALVSQKDYRHHQVISSVKNVPGTDWKLVTKIDTAEVVAPLLHLRNVLLLLVAIAAVLCVVCAWYLANFITSPIKYITRVVVKIRQGDLSQRVVVRSKDEIGVLGTAFNDMTANLVEAQARLAASISSLPFGFAVINLEGQIVFSNQALGKLLGRTIPTDLQASAETLKAINNDYKSSIDLLGTMHRAETKRRAIEKKVQVGPKFYRFFFLPIVSQSSTKEEVIGNVIMMEDISDAKAMERSRDEFFSIASHELRTPLTAIRGNVDMLLQYYPDILKDPSLKEMMTDIHGSSIRLIAIVNDFLDTSRLELGKIVFTKSIFSIKELIEQALREYEVSGSGKKLSLTLEPVAKSLPEVYADRDRARQIIINLLGNAIKFTEEGGVSVKLEHVKKMVKVSVTDTGRGIAEENQHLLFHKFQQASGSILTRDTTPSTGLGLYISKLLAENMGGKLYLARSEAGKGSTFTLELPVADGSNRLAKAPPATEK